MPPSSDMQIANFLSATDLTFDVAATDKQPLLQELARKVSSVLDMLPDLVFAELHYPCAISPDQPLGMLFRLRKPIDFDAVDGKPIDIVFLLPLSEAAGERLGALASISRELREPTARDALRRARNGAEIYRTLTTD
jgi:nitrogen PTS system EIIA component